MEYKASDVRCGRRRLGTMAMKLPCSFWFVLLFGAGGLVLFIHLQEISEMVQVQAPGVKLSMSPGQTAMKGQCSPGGTGASGDPGGTGRQDGRELSSTIAPMQSPASQWPQQSSTPSSWELDLGAARITKRHRKLLLKNPASTIRTFNSSTGLPKSSWERLSQIQEARKRLVREVCAKYKSGSKRPVTPHLVSRIFVEDKYKLLYCEVPKAGCSNWKRVLMVLGGMAASTGEIKHDAVHYGNHLKRLDSFDHQGIAQRLQTYTKVLFVREPFERLVSAFRDKFENPNTYYHPVFGKPIISKYRANASLAALRTGAGVTFKEFMQYLLDVHRPVGMDIHWERVNQLCSPCLLDYHFIGKFESMEEEANFLLQRTRAPQNLTFPKFKDRHPQAERTSVHITQQYFAQLNSTERQRAYDFYYMDYLMFNYSKPFKDLY